MAASVVPVGRAEAHVDVIVSGWPSVTTDGLYETPVMLGKSNTAELAIVMV